MFFFSRKVNQVGKGKEGKQQPLLKNMELAAHKWLQFLKPL